MEIQAPTQYDHCTDRVEAPIDLKRTPSSGSDSGAYVDSPENNFGYNSRRDSNGSQKSATQGAPRSRKNSKNEVLESGESGGSNSAPQKNSPATAFKKDACKKGFGDRKSRAAHGRGLPKKLGGGGSFTWGTPGCEIADKNKNLTGIHDPNYDPSEDPSIIFDSLEIEPSTEEIYTAMDEAIHEYFNNASLPDLLESLENLVLQNNQDTVLERLLEKVFELKNEHRELASKCLPFLVSKKYLNEIDIAKVFCNLLDRLTDLMLDTPDAPELLGKFIARADSERCLPVDFIKTERYQAHDSLTTRCLDYCYSLTKDQRTIRTCWGTTRGGFTDTSILTEKIRELLKEFVLSGDKDEAARCLKDLDVPHYHHELVYESILISMESEEDSVINSMCWLLQYMSKEGVLSVDQMHAGFSRFYSNVDDIQLDIPHVHTTLTKMVERAAQRKLISNKIRLMCPNKSRKRFSSESDANGSRDTCVSIRETGYRPRLGTTGSGLDSLVEDSKE